MKKRILVVGDIIVDKYTYVSTQRRASEASIPVWDVQGEEKRLGGAANVANNILSIGKNDVDVFLAGIVGNEDVNYGGIDISLSVSGRSMVKSRFVEDDRHLFRVDNLLKFRKDDVEFFEYTFKHMMWDWWQKFDAVVVSDYDKGTVTVDVVKTIRDVKASLFVVDSKREDLRVFAGFNLLKVNEDEYRRQKLNESYSIEDLFENCVVTKGKDGADLRRLGFRAETFPVLSTVAKDVTGCGDTHTAAMVCSLLRDDDVAKAIRFANDCARDVVQKFGTSVAAAAL